MEHDEKQQSKPCITCSLEIPVNAKVCTHCGNFQQSWMNSLKFTANIVGVLTVTAGAFTFVITKIPEIRKMLNWRDRVEVIAFAAHQPIVLANTGNREIFVTHLDLRQEQYGSSTQTLLVNESIKPEEIISSTTHSKDLEFLDQYSVVHGVSEEEFEKMVNLASYASSMNKDECLINVFVSPNDPVAIQYKDFLGDSLRFFKASGYINYYSLHKSEAYKDKIEMNGMLLRKNSPKCNNLSQK